MVFEVSNKGNLPIQNLVLSYVWKNKQGKVLHTQESYAVSGSFPPLRRGQTFIVKGTYAIEASEANIQMPEVKVIRID